MVYSLLAGAVTKPRVRSGISYSSNIPAVGGTKTLIVVITCGMSGFGF